MPHCPDCGSVKVVKNGKIHNGKQNPKCTSCGRQFVENPSWRQVTDESKALIDKLLLEKLPLAGIARVVGVVNQNHRALEPQSSRFFDQII